MYICTGINKRTHTMAQNKKKKFLIFLKPSQEAFNHNVLNKPRNTVSSFDRERERGRQAKKTKLKTTRTGIKNQKELYRSLL